MVDQIKKTNELKERKITEQFGKIIVFADPSNKEELRLPLEGIRALFSENKKISRLTLLLHKDFAAALEKVSIDGHSVQNVEECDTILHEIEFEKQFNQCAAYWNEVFPKYGVPNFEDLDADDQEIIALKWVAPILEYLDWYRDSLEPLVAKTSRLGIAFKKLCDYNQLESDVVTTDKILKTVSETIPAICEICLSVLKCKDYIEVLSDNKSRLLSGKCAQSKICHSLYEAICKKDVTKYALAFETLTETYTK